jgi:hypothetical protein
MDRRVISNLLMACLISIAASGQRKESKPKAESREVKIARARSAAPADIASAAKVVEQDENGHQTTLREGSNGFTCFSGHLGAVGAQPFCANAAALQWESELAQHKAGGTDWSATAPYATSGTPIKESPHGMIMWPFDPASTGLPTTPKLTGTWIMYSGTPWAHLMINQRP